MRSLSLPNGLTYSARLKPWDSFAFGITLERILDIAEAYECFAGYATLFHEKLLAPAGVMSDP